ncbi:WD40 repeat domain-containing protein [Yinghuangia seranimata]|uniref:WD40 repeat domain-containing protein n=1 Tax=Yinghuangia seranimata TaxID=408067 RepID=UPI00248CA011|nr:WD40 repeat domain-containing protein [Yinghuangia seranimata]MDI2127613.1 WD40 repeat domain-containing protein [Yinghuangia seranimata]
MDTDEITLVHQGFPKAKYVRLRVDGGWLRRESRGSASGTPRQSAKDYGSPTEAAYALDKETRKRMNDGFVMLRDPADAAVGEPVLVAAAPNRCSSAALDVHPQGHTLVVGTTLKEAYGAEIHLIDVATGVRRLVHTEPAGERQTFLHAVRFHADGQGVVYALNGETRYLDLADGRSRTLASYEQWQTADFNPFCLQPSWDRARRRLLVFDAGNRVRVLDDAGEPLLDLDVAQRPECRAGALSPSGRLLALAFGMEPAHVEVWDVDTGRQVQRHRFPFPFPENRGSAGCGGVDVLDFDPTERYVIANGGFAEGPFSMALDTGALAWAVPDPHRTDRWGTCYAWAFSPDGTRLAVGERGTVVLRDPATGAEAPVPQLHTGTGRAYRVTYTDAGDLLVCGGDSGRIVVLRA